ncbi:MAG: sugar phosphate nucleotidyltransferase [Ruminococcus sp.]|nr:sugar phosphate nucleotidyltransferase [Ruminococcus sp.]
MEKTPTTLILTGGDALRLRPLTCTKPAALLPVCGVPLLRYTLDLLEQHGFTRLFTAADRLSDQITNYLEDFPDMDFIITPAPEGTCSALTKTAEVCEENSHIITIFGNLLFDTDLNAALSHHEKSGADVTLLTLPKDVRSYSDGVLAVTDGENLVTELIPCAARENCRSETAAAGIFIFSRKTALKAADMGEDILADFLPKFIAKGGKVSAFTAQGYFCSASSFEGYFAANSDVLNGNYPSRPENVVRTADSRPELKLVPPAYIAPSAEISAGVEIGAGTVIGENVTVCRGAKLRGAVLMDGAFIGERATVNSGVIGTGARLLTGAAVYEGAVVGDAAVISEQAVVRGGVRIWNGRHIDAYACAAQDIKYGFLTPMRIGEDGICGETGSIITPQTAAACGSSLASLGRKIGIACKDSPASKSLALAVAAGVTSAGGEVWFFGASSAPALEYCTAKSGLAAGCWVEAGITAKIRLCSGDGLPLTRGEEKIIEGGVNRGEYKRASFSKFGEIRDAAAITRLYSAMIESTAPKKLSKIKAVLNTSGTAVNDLCGGILNKISNKNGAPVVFHIGSDGKGVSAYTDETGYVFEEKLLLLACMRRFAMGYDVALPYDFPKAADKLAKKFGSKVLRYSGCPSDPGDSEARRLAAETPFVRDGAALMMSVLEVLESRGITLAEAVAELPDMAVSTRFVPIDKQPVRLLRSVFAGGTATADGVEINDRKGRVLIRPVKTEKGVLMKVESYSMEAAAELCDFYQDLLRSN